MVFQPNVIDNQNQLNEKLINMLDQEIKTIFNLAIYDGTIYLIIIF